MEAWSKPLGRERADNGAQSPEGAAAVLLQRAQDIAVELRREAEEEAERRDRRGAAAPCRGAAAPTKRRLAAADRDLGDVARRLTDASSEAQAIVADASVEGEVLLLRRPRPSATVCSRRHGARRGAGSGSLPTTSVLMSAQQASRGDPATGGELTAVGAAPSPPASRWMERDSGCLLNAPRMCSSQVAA